MYALGASKTLRVSLAGHLLPTAAGICKCRPAILFSKRTMGRWSSSFGTEHQSVRRRQEDRDVCACVGRTTSTSRCGRCYLGQPSRTVNLCSVEEISVTQAELAPRVRTAKMFRRKWKFHVRTFAALHRVSSISTSPLAQTRRQAEHSKDYLESVT